MKKLFGSTFKVQGRVNIDGRDFMGRSISIDGDTVIVDGVLQGDTLVGPVSVTVHGDAERIETISGSVEVAGACGSVKTMSGDVRCGNVSGSVDTMSGDVTCGPIGGSVKSMSGDIRMRQ